MPLPKGWAFEEQTNLPQGWNFDAAGGGTTVISGNPDATRSETERMRKEFVKREGTLGTRLKETTAAEAGKNAVLEPFRLAQEVITVPLSSAKKGLYGLGAAGMTGGGMLRGMGLDAALQRGSKFMEGYTPIHGPLDTSVIGEGIGYGLEKATNAAEGATGNTGFAKAGIEAVGDIAGLVGGGKLAKAGAKKVAAAGEAGLRATRPAPTELQRLSKEHNIPLTAGEELNSPNLKQVEARLERLPILGTRKFRKNQGDALAQGAKNIADEFATAVEDPATTLIDRFKSNLKRGKEQANEAYAQIGEALKENGDAGAIEPVTTRSKIKSLLAESPDIFERLPGSQNRLKTIMAEIAGDTAPKKSMITVADDSGMIPQPKGKHGHGSAPAEKVLLDASGQPIIKTTPRTLSYDDYTWLRGQLGEYVDRAYKSAGSVGSNELRQLTIIKKALDTDFYRWGKNNGYDNVTAAVDNARQVYKTNVAPFENIPVLKSIVNDKFTPEHVLDAIAKPGQATLASRAMKGLTPADKMLVQDAIMRRALAIGLEGAKDGAPISAAKYATFFEKMDTKTRNAAQSPMDVIFSPAEKQRVMGFAKLARAAERAGQYSANPLTGVAAADFAIPSAIGATAGFVGVPAATSAAAMTKAMSLMLTTPKGKAILHRAYRLPEGAKAGWDSVISDTARILRDERGLVGKDINSYQGGHKPMTVEGGAATLDDLTPAFGEDIYGTNAARYYGTGDTVLDRQTLSVLKSVRGKPDAEITVYRAVPKDANVSALNKGDWVTVNKKYAEMHGEGVLEGQYKIVEQRVKASDLTTNADSFHEQGYYPKEQPRRKRK